jgi:hypothetical protein
LSKSRCETGTVTFSFLDFNIIAEIAKKKKIVIIRFRQKMKLMIKEGKKCLPRPKQDTQ